MEKKTVRSKQKKSDKKAASQSIGAGANSAGPGYFFGNLKKFDLGGSLDAPGGSEAWDESDPFLDRPPLYFT